MVRLHYVARHGQLVGDDATADARRDDAGELPRRRERGRAVMRSLMDSLMADVSAGLRVLVTRDGVPLTEDMVRERAANIVSGLVGNYDIKPWTGVRYARPVVTEEDFSNEGRIR
jgi:hypothetical protein